MICKEYSIFPAEALLVLSCDSLKFAACTFERGKNAADQYYREKKTLLGYTSASGGIHIYMHGCYFFFFIGESGSLSCSQYLFYRLYTKTEKWVAIILLWEEQVPHKQ